MSFKFLCKLGWHRWPVFVNPMTQAPAPVRCLRCGARYGW